MWVWALCGSRHFKPMSYSVRLHWPYRGELIIVSLETAKSPKNERVRVYTRFPLWYAYVCIKEPLTASPYMDTDYLYRLNRVFS
jgi:hypothetical protein